MNAISIAACAGLLAACGDGGGGTVSGGLEDLEGVRQATGLAPPVETPAAQAVRAPGIVTRADSLVLSTRHGRTSHSDLPAFRIHARCSGISCWLTDGAWQIPFAAGVSP
ncbi:MAG: hypothetical protein F4145_08460 [Boseongicola sp. SB0675_bin_26]|nr:hypothetical protein [Boseongicola sp. SB0675_bin_26]